MPAARPGASGAEPAVAAPPQPRKLTIANTSVGSAIPFVVAQETGMFARQGLEVEVPLLAGVKSVQSLVAGQVEYGIISSRTTTDANLAGAELVMLAGLSPTLNFLIYGPPELAGPADLRGKTIGIVQFGASADFAARYALRRHGLEAERDYALFQTGGMPESLAALRSGGIHAAVLSAPTTLQARKGGLVPVVDILAMNIDYISGALVTSQGFLAHEPDTTRRLLAGLLEGIQFAKTRPAETKQYMGPHFKTDDAEVLEESYQLSVERLLPRVPYVSVAGIRTVLDEAAAAVPAARGLAPESLIDNSWLTELEARGLVKQLWGD